ncbi:MAG: HDIG domain-containing protein [Deltaproteobacteria bacterium]|nr:HDIG domain-containing protein [Deltaproteobacteria bacterium]
MNVLKWIKNIAVREPARTDREPYNEPQTLALYAFCIAMSFFISFFSSGYFRMDIPGYGVGDIARKDVIVSSDLLIKDEGATRARQIEAREKSLPVYRHDPAVRNKILSGLKDAFARCRNVVEQETVIKRTRKPSYQSLSPGVRKDINNIIENMGVSPPMDDLMSFLVQENFSPVLETLIEKLVKQSYPSFVAAEDSVLSGLQANATVYAADVATGKSAAVSLEQIKTLRQTRESIYQKAIKDPGISDSWKPHIRRILDGIIVPNLSFDAAMTVARQDEDAGNVDPVLRQLKKGKVIIRRGDEIGPMQIVQLDAIRSVSKGVSHTTRIVGMGLLISFTLFIFIFLLRFVPRGQWDYYRLAFFCLICLIVNILLLQALWFIGQSLSQNFLAPPFNDKAYFLYVLPFAYGAMLAALLAGESCALLFVLVFSVLVGQSITINFPQLFYVLLSGLIGILLMRKAVVLRVGIIWAGFKLGFAAIVLFLLLQLVQQEHVDFIDLGFGAVLAFLSGPLTAFFIMFTLPLFEYLFMVTTEIRLSEMSNLNLPLVRELIVKAPGTYNHSIAVGTLCEGAAKVIGQNPLFLRVASLYHDIGKTLQPEYFKENQGQFNPHDAISPDKSVALLKAHVTQGARIAAEAKLPPAIVDLIIQHHGTRRIYYFYEKAKGQANNPEVDCPEKAFRYDGPKPQTKAACILMLADSIEAASRTLTDHSRETMLNLIQSVIGDVAGDGQFSECDITLAEIDHIAFSFLETLLNYYHQRIVYPGFDTQSVSSVR